MSNQDQSFEKYLMTEMAGLHVLHIDGIGMAKEILDAHNAELLAVLERLKSEADYIGTPDLGSVLLGALDEAIAKLKGKEK